jgi:hypothetical protein
MRFILGVLVGYSIRGNEKRLITVLAAIAFIVYIVLPAIMLLALSLDVRKERQSRPSSNQSSGTQRIDLRRRRGQTPRL